MIILTLPPCRRRRACSVDLQGLSAARADPGPGGGARGDAQPGGDRGPGWPSGPIEVRLAPGPGARGQAHFHWVRLWGAAGGCRASAASSVRVRGAQRLPPHGVPRYLPAAESGGRATSWEKGR